MDEDVSKTADVFFCYREKLCVEVILLMSFEIMYEKECAEYREKTPESERLYKRFCGCLAGGETRSVSYYHPYPLTIDHGKGCEIFDADGNRYYDFVNNYTSLIHGHANPQVLEAMYSAAQKGTAAPAGLIEQMELAEYICGRVPSVERMRFCNSGTEATLFAVRAAKAFTGKTGLLKALGGYHGTTDMMEYNVSPGWKPGHPEELYIPRPDIRGVSERIADEMYIMPYNNLEATEHILEKHADSIAAIIIEPFLGAGGLIPAAPGYLAGLRKLADKYQVLLIFDEVQAFRLSDGGAQKRFGVKPDLTAFGKIIGGGLAVGGFGGRKDIMDVFNPEKAGFLSQSGTFNGNRPTMAAGLETLKLYTQAECDRLERLAERLQAKLEKAYQESGVTGCITRSGSLMNYHFTAVVPRDYETVSTDNREYLKLMHLKLLKRGIFAAPRGMFVLSTPMDEAVIDAAGDAFCNAMKELVQQAGG